MFYAVYFRTNPFVLFVLLFVIIRNSFEWESSPTKDPTKFTNLEGLSNRRKVLSITKREGLRDTDPSKLLESEIKNPSMLRSQSVINPIPHVSLDSKNMFQKPNERDTLFRLSYMFPAPEQDLSRPTASKRTKFFSEYTKVVKVHFFVLVLPVILDMIVLIIFNLRNDAQYLEHFSIIFGKDFLNIDYILKCLVIVLR